MKSKKILLGSLSTMALVATPIAAVVSCGDDAAAKKDAKIVKSNAKGFVIDDGDLKIFIPETIAKKAGSINFAKVKYSWTKEMEAGKKLKATSLTKDEDSSSTPKDVKISKSDAQHFVLPVKGLTGGVGLYVDREIGKYWVGQLLTMEKLDLNLPTATKDGKNTITNDGITKLNTFLKVMDLTVESVELILHEATANNPKYTIYKINWAKTDAKTDGKTGGKVNPTVKDNFIRKINADDKGFVIVIGPPQTQQQPRPQQRVFITEEEAKTETSIKIGNTTLILPVITKTSTNLKGKIMMSAVDFKSAQDDARKIAEDAEKAKNPTPSAADITAAGDAAVARVKNFNEIPLGSITSTLTTGNYLMGKRFVARNVNELKETVKFILGTVDGKGIYKFEFTAASLQTNTPLLTTESDAAFKKIFTDLGLTLSHLVFTKSSMGTVSTISVIQIKSLDLA